MKLLPESNSFHKVNMREKLSKLVILKYIAIILLAVFGVGFLLQMAYNFVGNEKIGSRINYTRLDGKRIEYKQGGAGDFTVIFDGSIGGGSSEWTEIAEKTSKELGVKTFVYDRRGYGFSDGGDALTPEAQAVQLKDILRKAAAQGPYILVGEEYGSLVMTNFAKKYPDLVKGVVLVDPLDEKTMSEDIKFFDSFYKKVQSFGSNIFLTWTLDKLGLATKFTNYENKLKYDYEKYNYSWQKNQSPYRQAISNETSMIKSGKSNSQTDGMFKDIPLYIISGADNSPLARLGSSDLTNQYKTSYSGGFTSMNNEDSILKALSRVVDSARRIERKNNGNN
ncbi:alpha/beta hydrolase [Clostridium chrysemydis]|uniref:alpha/beta hydrolase n=1 Tax=Clostridium chrysemydis TaxID=2665504 RepID=UPI0018845B39|nr:alpha/beta fold hydrolase [Clostridium chrysemydis]